MSRSADRPAIAGSPFADFAAPKKSDLLVYAEGLKWVRFGRCGYVGRKVRIPMKPAMHSKLKPATRSDLKPAIVPI
jgi:hypothetical protein